MNNKTMGLERFHTEVRGLDEVLRGGLLQGGVYIVQGVPGAGKTILANEICYRYVARGGKAIYVTLLAESHSRMLLHLRPMSFFNEQFLPEQLRYISAFNMLETEGLKGLLALIKREIRAQDSGLVVVDGLVAAQELAPSEQDFKKFIHELQTYTGSEGCTALLLTSGDRQMVSPEHTMVDGLVRLDDEVIQSRAVRMLSVLKFRGSGFLRGRHAYRITSDGIRLYPRLEAALTEPTVRDPGQGPKEPLGVPSLDRMMEGGLCGSSVTGLVGPTGSGKTIFCLQYLAACDANTPGLMFNFFESPQRLLVKAKAVGLDLSPSLKKGHLEFIWHPQAENQLDELGYKLLDAVRARKVKRLAIDGLGGILSSVTHPERIHRFFACLMNELRARKVTTVLTIESTMLTSSELKVPVENFSALVENLIFLRFVEREGTFGRLVSIAKMRNSDYDRHVREFLITSSGIKVGETLLRVQGSLTGSARSPRKQPSKRNRRR